MAELVWLIPAFPLLGFAIILLVGRRLGEPLAGWVATLMVFASFAVSALIYLDLLDRAEEDRAEVVTLFSWVPVAGDPLCLAAGWIGIPWIPALVYIGLGKALRYGLLLLII